MFLTPAIGRARRAATSRLKRGWGGVLDTAEAVTGRRDPLVPPRRLLTADYGEFQELGRTFRDAFIHCGGLRQHHTVLDVGCGPGRMAAPLTSFLTGGGAYEGFDLVAEAVRWCQANITPRFPNFRFTEVDIYNRLYNPKGSIQARAFQFPYDDGVFDFAILTSVFTHMSPPEVERYLSELRRVLTPDGRIFSTWFLINDEAQDLIDRGKSYYGFRHQSGPVRIEDRASPEAAVAYPEEWIMSRLAERGLTVASFHEGYWCGRDHAIKWRWQDALVLKPIQM